MIECDMLAFSSIQTTQPKEMMSSIAEIGLSNLPNISISWVFL